MRMGKLGLLALVAAGIIGLGSQANANSIDYTGGPTVANLGGGVFQYTYTFQITSDNAVNPNDGFVIFDVPGLLGASLLSAPVGWTATEQATGPLNPDTNTGAADTAGLTNVYFKYTGATPILGGLSGQSLGNFSFQIGGGPLSPTGKLYGEAQYQNLANSPSTQTQFNSITMPTAVPVPEAAWMGLSTLVGLGALGAFRKRVKIA